MGELTLSDEFITEAVNKYSDTIIDSVMKLPVKYSTVIHLFYYEDMQIKEIAEILNIKQSTVKQRLARCEKLKKLLYKGNRQIRHAYTNRPESDTITENAKGGGYGDRTGRGFVSQKIYRQRTQRAGILP